jgi:hypothetical protein
VRRYEEHLTRDAVAAGLEARPDAPGFASSALTAALRHTVSLPVTQSGALFCGAIRVNARRRHQAYVSLEGVTGDVLFDGLASQNRAVSR